jgi:PTS system galactitol-specific IIB component
MASKKMTILAVCGSGVVSCSMVSQKVKEILAPLGIQAEVIGTLPQSVKDYTDRGNIDFVVATSPIPGKISVPLIKGVALLTGFGEEQCITEIQNAAKKILADRQARV